MASMHSSGNGISNPGHQGHAAGPGQGQQQKIIGLQEGWTKVYTNGILKLQNIIKRRGEGNAAADTFTHAEYMELYTTIYQMCIQKHPHCHTQQLYDNFEQYLITYLQDTVRPAIAKNEGEFGVRELVQRWDDHKVMKRWLVDFFRYLDRFYVKRYSKESLQDVCISRFKTVVFDPIKPKITASLLELIARDRNHEDVTRDLIRDAVQIYVEMGMGALAVYVHDFETPFLQSTLSYYGGQALGWLSSDSCPEFMRKAETRIGEERRRLASYLHPSSEEKLMEHLFRTLLLTHQEEILGKQNTGCKVLLETNSLDDLARIFNLYSNVPFSLEPIGAIVKRHIVDVGNALIEKVDAEKNHDNYVENLITMHDKYYEMVMMCFKGHNVFQKALKEAFEAIVNKRTFQSSTAELVAEYADAVLKKGGLKLSEKALQTTLDNIVRLFAYLSDKDLFSEFYRKLLSKRLLLQRSASMDAEKSMIGKLKLRCGAQYTSKLEGMINDMRQADEHGPAFAEYVRENHIDLDNVDFQVQTLAMGFWPTYPTDEVKLPLQLARCVDAFKMYYSTKTNNRKLRWIDKLGVLTVTGHFKAKKIDLVVSTTQASILLLLNHTGEISIDEITTHLSLEPDNVKRQLKSLVNSQFKILVKVPAEGYKTDHKIRVNVDFTDQHSRIRIPNAVLNTTEKERVGAQQTVQEDRKHAIEANIVRVMKARKTLEHSQLMTEVSQHLFQYFRPDPKQIKKRIEDLIAREYLERDKDKTNVYHYIA